MRESRILGAASAQRPFADALRRFAE